MIEPFLGANDLATPGVRFRVWAPSPKEIRLRLIAPDFSYIMPRDEDGYAELAIESAGDGTRYFFLVDGEPRPDPASRYQPDGVHGVSEVINRFFPWTDQNFECPPLREMVFYELHVGTFTEEGTFDAAIERLDDLAKLGVTTVELMPVAAFPGDRNWGYDGVLPYAVHAGYGGPRALRRFVDAAHARGLAVALDVVYNHFGPEGNYLRDFGPYFTDKFYTPWGEALCFDGPNSDQVRRYFIENAVGWINEFHIDVLRLDAVHAIFDQSAYPFLEELTDRVHEAGRELGRRVLVIAESDLNDPRLLRAKRAGGFGMDGQWADDFHHAMHALLTGERDGYYEDFGSVAHLGHALERNYVYEGQVSDHRKRRHGKPAVDLPPEMFVVCVQNHDQIGNRMKGERMSTLVSFEKLKLGMGTLLCAPFTPLLFMGEEHAEKAPFQYFVSHNDPALIEAVREGRKEEFASFGWEGEPPDPQSPGTFERSKPDWSLVEGDAKSEHVVMRRFTEKLLTLRKTHPALGPVAEGTDVERRAITLEAADTVLLLRRVGKRHALLCMCFSDAPVDVTSAVPAGPWTKVLDSAETRWKGPGATTPETVESGTPVELAPSSFTLYLREEGRS